jgi:hypothetical protein
MSFLGKVTGPFRKLWLPAVLLAVLGCLTAVRLYFASSTRRQADDPAARQAAQAKSVAKPATGKEPAPQPATQQFGETFSNFVLPPDTSRKNEAPRPPPIPEEIKRRLVNSPTPISLFPYHPAPAKTPPPLPPTYYLPSFRLIRCELIGGPESGNIEAPLIGIVLENQYNIDPDGVTRLVVPAGVEVHGVGKPAPSRDRIDGNGKWTFVWRSTDSNNGLELSVSALALNRDYDEAKHVYGDTEKSPGIAGRRFESLGDEAIQEALLASIAAVTRNVQSQVSVLNPLTSQIVSEPKPSIGNALLQGGAAGTDRIAQMVDDIRKQIDDKGYYVAVLPGKEFYLYTKEPIDLRYARRPGTAEVGAKANPATRL